MGTHKHTDSFRTHTDITCAHICTYGFLSVLQKKGGKHYVYILYLLFSHSTISLENPLSHLV